MLPPCPGAVSLKLQSYPSPVLPPTPSFPLKPGGTDGMQHHPSTPKKSRPSSLMGFTTEERKKMTAKSFGDTGEPLQRALGRIFSLGRFSRPLDLGGPRAHACSPQMPGEIWLKYL